MFNFTFNRNIVLSFAAGLVVGVLGYKVYQEHKGEIEAKLNGFSGAAGNDGCAAGSCEGNVTLEELEAQKERLEDLIAEQKAKSNNQ